MKRLLFVLVFCLFLVTFVDGASLNFQDPGQFSCTNNISDMGCRPVRPAGGSYWSPGLTAGNGKLIVVGDDVGIENIVAYPMDYWAASIATWPYSGFDYQAITFQNAAHTILWSANINYLPINGAGNYDRYEMKMIGGTVNLYREGNLIATSAPIPTNPSYIGIIAHNYPGGWTLLPVDDWVQGSSSNPVVLGLPMSDQFFIKKDMVSPGASGVYNTTTGALVDSNYMYATFSRSNITGTFVTNDSIYLINRDSGTIYETQYTAFKSTGTLRYNIASSLVAASAPYGRYSLKYGSMISDQWISYIANGASIAFDSNSYSQGDTASITYLIDGAYWDTSTYTYAMKIYRGNDWSVASTQNIAASSGTFTYMFTSSDTQGAYYAVIVATPNAGGSGIWMNYDYANVNAYFTMYGYVNDAQNATVISGATVNVTQGSIISNVTTNAYGNYSVTGYLTGASLSVNANATGHKQYYAQFTPMTAGSKYINITLNATSPSFSGIGIGGVARDGVFSGTTITSGYGRPISGASVFVKNTSTGEYYVISTNNAGWYLCDVGTSCTLVNERPYNIWGQKIGYSNSPNYTVVTG